jgi:hypothetical protein
MADLITLDDYKTFEGISSTKEDEKLEVLIPSVSQLVKTYCANSINDFVTVAKEEFFTLDYATDTIQLTEAPVLAISSVQIKEKIGDAYATLEATKYDIDKRTDSLIRLESTGYKQWPQGPNSVKVTYTAGYATVPLDLKLAVVDLITYYLKDEHKPRSTLSGATQEYNGATRDTGFPDHIRRVLDLYRQLP